MSCWVSLSVASQYWNIPLSDLLQRVSVNAVASRVEAGMLLIDLHRPAGPAVAAAHESQLPEAAESDFGDWRAARAATSRTRKAPVLH